MKTQIKQNWKAYLIELIIVFIGITAGLMLENLRENNKKREKEKLYIESFIEEIGFNCTELDSVIIKNQRSNKIVAGVILKYFVHEKKIVLDSVKLATKELVSVEELSTRTNTYDDITASGNLHLISDFRVRKEIVNYYSKLREAKDLEDFYMNYMQQFILPFLVEKVNLFNVEFAEPEVANSLRYRNILAGHYSLLEQKIDRYTKLDSIGDQLSKNLKQYKKDKL